MMNEKEYVVQFFNSVVALTNQMRTCGEEITYMIKIEKVLRTLTSNFNHIVVAIEESNTLSAMKLEEL